MSTRKIDVSERFLIAAARVSRPSPPKRDHEFVLAIAETWLSDHGKMIERASAAERRVTNVKQRSVLRCTTLVMPVAWLLGSAIAFAFLVVLDEYLLLSASAEAYAAGGFWILSVIVVWGVSAVALKRSKLKSPLPLPWRLVFGGAWILFPLAVCYVWFMASAWANL